ncbi:MAG: helicase-related protein [Opitutaceae bacterium]|nr:helicase-related protein [Opitutaceae bacterium]
MNDKITSKHVERAAYVYIRQSTMQQVRHNLESKLLIFTEHRETLNYLKENLAKWNYSTCEIQGGMNPHERKHAQELFRTSSQVCTATETVEPLDVRCFQVHEQYWL